MTVSDVQKSRLACIYRGKLDAPFLFSAKFAAVVQGHRTEKFNQDTVLPNRRTRGHPTVLINARALDNRTGTKLRMRGLTYTFLPGVTSSRP